MQHASLTACPHCGATDGYYRTMRYNEVGKFYYYFADLPSGNDARPHTKYYASTRLRESKTAYCVRCEKKVGSITEEKAR